MSNVINFPASVSAPPVLSIPQELDYEVRSAPALFEPIKGAGVVDGLGYQNFRTDTEQALGAVQERYKIVQNSELFASLAQALEGAAPARALEGAKIKPSISYGGRQAFADFRLAAGAIDGFCSNGMIFGSYDLFGRRHTKGFNQKDLSDFVGNSFVLFQEKITELRRETFAPIELTQAEEFLKKNFSDRRAAQLLERFAVEAQERGATVWALRSALTYYASHNSSQFAVRNTGQDSSAAVLYGRENEIASLFVGAGWRELLAA